MGRLHFARNGWLAYALAVYFRLPVILRGPAIATPGLTRRFSDATMQKELAVVKPYLSRTGRNGKPAGHCERLAELIRSAGLPFTTWAETIHRTVGPIASLDADRRTCYRRRFNQAYRDSMKIAIADGRFRWENGGSPGSEMTAAYEALSGV